MTNRIPCSVQILTRNSGATLQRALESVRGFAEVIVIDGSSTDETLDIARAFGARILTQDPAYLDKSGHIVNFAGVRNQGLDASREEWLFYLDSDEYLGEDMVASVAQIIHEHKIGAYFVNRRYVRGGVVVDCATTYPNRQIRFFARSIVERFIKEVHERIALKEGIAPGTLKGSLYVPLDFTREEIRKKWDHYIAIEVARHTPTTWKVVATTVVSNSKVSLLYLYRLVRNALLCRGTKLPLWIELERHRYHFIYIVALVRAKILPLDSAKRRAAYNHSTQL